MLTVEKDGTEVRIGPEVGPAPIPQVQGEVHKEVKEDNRNEESKVTTKPKEHLSIQTLVTLRVFVSPLTSQTLQRMRIDATPL